MEEWIASFIKQPYNKLSIKLNWKWFTENAEVSFTWENLICI